MDDPVEQARSAARHAYQLENIADPAPQEPK